MLLAGMDEIHSEGHFHSLMMTMCQNYYRTFLYYGELAHTHGTKLFVQ